MALDPNIILAANNFPKMDVGQTLQLREIVGARRSAEVEAQRQRQLAAAAQQRRQTIGGLAAQGDYAGARTQALGAGDFDLADAVGKMDDAAKAKALAKTQAGASVLFAASKQPPEVRAGVIAAAAPTLAQQGYTPEEIAKLGSDLSDAGIEGNLAGALTLTQQLERSDKAADRALRASEADATRQFQRGNAYIAAGLMPPGEGGGAGGAAASVGAGGGGTRYGWTPRARDGGDNNDAAVDGKIAGMSQALGIDPRTPFPAGMTDMQIARALTLSEGGKGSLADRNNNPGNLINPRTGGFQRFPSKEEGLRAAARQVARNRARGQNSIATMVEGLPVSGNSAAAAGASVTNIIPGGKIDRQRIADERADAREARAEARENRTAATTSGKEAMQLRKEFDGLPEVKKFKTVRTAAQQVRALGGKKEPTATDDIALIFSYMRMLDPDSVVREGEYATARNAAGVPDRIRNLYNKAKDGTQLTPDQRKNMIASAGSVYAPLRETYNEVARKYRGYAEAAGIDPAKVAYVATPDGQRQRGTLSPRGRPAARAVPSDIAAILEKYR